MDILGKSKIWLGIAGGLMFLAILALSLWGLNLGIDFKGGSLLEMQMDPRAKIGEMEKSLSGFNLKNLKITPSEQKKYIVRTEQISEKQKNQILEKLQKQFSKSQITETRFETVGPVVSKDLTTKALWAVFIATIAIILYIAWAFKSIPKPANSFKFGISAIIAMLHDLLIVIGVFSLLGHFFNVEIDTLFITALLTIMGYSVNDTIVIYDRIRESLIKRTEGDFKTIANTAIVETLPRSLNTGMTALFALIVLYIVLGSSIKFFLLALILGIISGTYSSICIAPPILVFWHKQIGRK